jgi:hypothetical protein
MRRRLGVNVGDRVLVSEQGNGALSVQPVKSVVGRTYGALREYANPVLLDWKKVEEIMRDEKALNAMSEGVDSD